MRTAIVGVGRMGRRHVQAALALGHEVVGIMDINQASLQQTKDQHGVSEDRWFADAAKMLEQSKPDLWIVSTTAPTHCDLTCMAAEAGVPFVLCEKPMAISLEQCDRMLSSCEKAGTKLSINHPMRFMEVYMEPKDIVHSTAFGGLSSMNVLSGNLGIAMNGTHFCEAFRLIAGERVESVQAWLSADPIPNPRGAEFSDLGGQMRAVTSSGKRLNFEIGADQGHGVCTTYMGPNGVLFVNQLSGKMELSVRDESVRDKPSYLYGEKSVDTSLVLSPGDPMEWAKKGIQALINGGDYPTGDDGRQAVAVIAAAHHSHDSEGVSVMVGSPGIPRNREFPWA